MPDLKSHYDITDLFAQLGLPNDENSINNFIEQHCPLSAIIAIWDAPWWNKAQAEFLHEALHENANWQYAVDELNTRLRAKM